MAKDGKDKRRGRLSRSGHTSHGPYVPGRPPSGYPAGPRPQDAAPRYDPRYDDPPAPRSGPPPLRYPEERYAPSRGYDRPRHDGARPYGERHYGEPRYSEPHYSEPHYSDSRYRDGSQRPGGNRGYGGKAGTARVIGRAALRGTNSAARTVTRKVISASKSDGAEESGLTPLIWNQVLNYGADAMVTVALAGTVFFGASAHAQRGNVLLYLLITMAPFSLIAPVIGPALDRLQHGRRWTMGGTAVGRCVLALVMAAHPTELLVLYPCALGSLVLSKAYAVIRAAAAPRLVPPGMTLTQANSRLTIFGLGSTLVLGGFVGVLIKVSGSYSFGLIVTAIAFAACAFFAIRLPSQVDSAVAAPLHPQEPGRPRRQPNVPRLARIHSWARRGFDPHLVIALQGESMLRLLSGMLTIYLAFYVESTSHGLTAVLELGMVVGAAGFGNFLGTAIGTRVTMSKPELFVVIAVCVAGVVCLLVSVSFSPALAAAAMLIASIGNSLSKIALDALIQRDVVETLRSSAFGRSETFLQMAWVIGAALGVVLPSTDGDGPIGFVVAGTLVTAAGIVVALRLRALTGTKQRHDWQDRPDSPGSVLPRSVD